MITSATSAEPASVERVVALRDARRVVVRPVRPEDDGGLMRLYGTLDSDDRYRRFFGVYSPDAAFFTQMATVGERGGARLVAVLRGPEPDDEQIVGEAGYMPLPNGDGELAIVVAPGWRGWLGPYLLDALVEAAAALGIPNLEADVLTVNGPMLALLHSRGSAVMDHEGWSAIRLIIGTSGRQPTWPGPHDRPRVLVEGAGSRWHAEERAHAAGLQLLTCADAIDGYHGCPALAGRRCPLAAEADVIVVSGLLDDERWRELLSGHANVHPGVPVCLEGADLRDDEALPAFVRPVGPDEDILTVVHQIAERRERGRAR